MPRVILDGTKTGVRIDIIGDVELQNALNRLPDRIEKAIVRRHIRAAMRPIFQEVYRRLPVKPSKGEGERTTPIKQGLKMLAQRFRRSLRKFGIITVIPRRSDMGIPSDDKYFYPIAIEYGTSRSAARPFMRPAFDAKRGQALAILESGIRQDVDREFAKNYGTT